MPKLEITVETMVHAIVRELVEQMEEKHGIRINSIHRRIGLNAPTSRTTAERIQARDHDKQHHRLDRLAVTTRKT